MLPLVVTQAPLAAGAAIAWAVLFLNAFPEADHTRFTDPPRGLVLSLVLTAAVYALFTFIGLAATVASANAVITGKPIGLAAALDPAFTRMGGVLLLGGFIALITFSAITLILTVIGAALMFYILLRYSLAFHVFTIEAASPGAALRGSWQMMRGNMLRILTIVAGAAAFGAVAFFAGLLITGIAATPFVTSDPSRQTEVIFVAISIAALGVSVVPVGAFIATSTTLFYINERKRDRV